MKNAGPKIRLALIAILVVGGASRVHAEDHPLLKMLKFVFNHISAANDKEQQAKKFIKLTSGSIVITNESKQAWKFGVIAQTSEVGRDQSGQVQVQGVRNDGISLFPPETLAVGGATTIIGPNYGTIAVTPVLATKHLGLTKNAFFRVCYLEDAQGKRLYFNLVKDAASTPPTFGLTQASWKGLNPVPFEVSSLGQKNLFGITVDKL